jgi:peptide-methionine (S)-S-oxide reductase
MASKGILDRLAGASAVVALVAAVSMLAWTQAPKAAEPAVAIAAPAFDPPSSAKTETAVLAGGCFWGMQAVFEHVKGVKSVLAGYSGGDPANPSYEQVSTETTGHAESVKIVYDPAKVSYGKLLQVYFSVAHNPTQLNYQGPDHGTSYRSNIFYTTAAQKKVAEAYIKQLADAKSFDNPIVTRIDAFKAFYPAEDYHQDFLIKNPAYPYIVVNDAPKLVNFKRLLPDLYSDTPVRVASAN